jgi:hypothetical protein
LSINTWHHLSATYGSATDPMLRLYVDGVQVASLALTSNLRVSGRPLFIGGNAFWGEWFAGTIDDVAIYNRVLSAAEIADAAGAAPGGTAPAITTQPLSQTIPSGTTATLNVVATGTAPLSYQWYQGTTGITTTPVGTNSASFTTPALTVATNYWVRVTNAFGTADSATAAISIGAAVPLSIAITGPAINATVGGTATIYATVTGAATSVDFLVNAVVVGSDPTAAAGGVYTFAWNSTTVPDGLVTLTARANAVVPVTSVGVAARVINTGLVARYDFNEASGNALDAAVGIVGGDAANNGTLSGGATRVADRSATSGGAVQFDGTSGLITVPDAASLDLTSGMTLSAWVRPTALSGWQTVILKECGDPVATCAGTTSSTGLVYSLYANNDTDGGPGSTVKVVGQTTDQSAINAPPLSINTWHHLSATYGSATDPMLRLYVDGVQVASLPLTSNLRVSGRSLFIGGNQFWGEWFAGTIDDVTIYNRVLSAAEIAAVAQ